jgi:hypothetical protein
LRVRRRRRNVGFPSERLRCVAWESFPVTRIERSEIRPTVDPSTRHTPNGIQV